jgi:hypothetical protein
MFHGQKEIERCILSEKYAFFTRGAFSRKIKKFTAKLRVTNFREKKVPKSDGHQVYFLVFSFRSWIVLSC